MVLEEFEGAQGLLDAKTMRDAICEDKRPVRGKEAYVLARQWDEWRDVDSVGREAADDRRRKGKNFSC